MLWASYFQVNSRIFNTNSNHGCTKPNPGKFSQGQSKDTRGNAKQKIHAILTRNGKYGILLTCIDNDHQNLIYFEHKCWLSNQKKTNTLTILFFQANRAKRLQRYLFPENVIIKVQKGTSKCHMSHVQQGQCKVLLGAMK